jgi:hypothetical protein
MLAEALHRQGDFAGEMKVKTHCMQTAMRGPEFLLQRHGTKGAVPDINKYCVVTFVTFGALSRSDHEMHYEFRLKASKQFELQQVLVMQAFHFESEAAKASA